jgi:hypothetical protein
MPGCRTRFDEQAWGSLRLAERIDAEQVARLVLNWPRTECIEVRNCGSCEKPISVRRASTRLEAGGDQVRDVAVSTIDDSDDPGVDG